MMNKIYLFAFLISIASANTAIDIADSFISSRDTWKCLADKNITRVIPKIAHGAGTIYSDFLDTFNYAKDAGFDSIDARLVINDAMIPEEISAKVAQALPPTFNGTVWLSVTNSENLWGREISQRIPYIESLVLAFKQHGVSVGIHSSLPAWLAIFESPKAGSDILKAVPAWYALYNRVPTLEDWGYGGFGTWDHGVMKSYQTYVDICGVLINTLDFYGL